MLPRGLPLPQMTTTWATALDPIIKNQLVQGILISDIAIANGTTVINHKLGRKQIGFIITDINGAATIYRSQPLNDLQLTLTSNAAVTISLWMF